MDATPKTPEKGDAQYAWFNMLPKMKIFGVGRLCTVSQVAVSSAFDDAAEGVLDPFVAGEVERVGRAGAHHGDVEAP